jgi:hypothetical protein
MITAEYSVQRIGNVRHARVPAKSAIAAGQGEHQVVAEGVSFECFQISAREAAQEGE